MTLRKTIADPLKYMT